MLFSVISSCFGFPVGTIGGKYKEHVYFWDPAMRDEKGRGVRTVLASRCRGSRKDLVPKPSWGPPIPPIPKNRHLGIKIC